MQFRIIEKIKEVQKNRRQKINEIFFNNSKEIDKWSTGGEEKKL